MTERHHEIRLTALELKLLRQIVDVARLFHLLNDEKRAALGRIDRKLEES